MFRAEHEIRDPVHGLIRLSDQEVRIIDSPKFQRLRRIKQLALAQLVYPGALHTRFEHSLGTLHVAAQIVATVARKEQVCQGDVALVRLAALLHDIGHGPFSHVSEYLLVEYAQSQTETRDKIHEKLTVDIITYEPSISNELTDSQLEAVCLLIEGTPQKDMRRDIVSSNLDADKIDYLSRDAYYAGVKYGTIDKDKIIDSFTMVRSGEETFLGIEEEAIFAVEQLILAKHHMTQQVYAHRVRVITDFMIVRGLKLAVEDGLTEVKELYSYESTPDFCQNYMKYDDERIFDIVLGCDLERPKSIFERLRSRKLFKQLLRLPLTARYVPNHITRSRLLSLSAEEKAHLETIIAERLGCRPWEVIVNDMNVKNPAYQAPGAIDPEEVLVIPRQGEPQSMDAYEELVSAKLPSFQTLHVIGPPSQESDLERVIKEIVLDQVGGSA